MNLRIARRSSRGPGLRSEIGRDRAGGAAGGGGGVSHRRGPAGGPATMKAAEAVARVHSEDAHTSSWNNSSFAR
jgi:hypothetical protein